jgi:hypothetical protein
LSLKSFSVANNVPSRSVEGSQFWLTSTAPAFIVCMRERLNSPSDRTMAKTTENNRLTFRETFKSCHNRITASELTFFGLIAATDLQIMNQQGRSTPDLVTKSSIPGRCSRLTATIRAKAKKRFMADEPVDSVIIGRRGMIAGAAGAATLTVQTGAGRLATARRYFARPGVPGRRRLSAGGGCRL